MPTTITSAGVTFNDTTTLTSANIGTAQLVNGSVTAAKLGTNEQKQIAKAWVNFRGFDVSNTAILSSVNISSITRSSAGTYVVNLNNGIYSNAKICALVSIGTNYSTTWTTNWAPVINTSYNLVTGVASATILFYTTDYDMNYNVVFF